VSLLKPVEDESVPGGRKELYAHLVLAVLPWAFDALARDWADGLQVPLLHAAPSHLACTISGYRHQVCYVVKASSVCTSHRVQGAMQINLGEHSVEPMLTFPERPVGQDLLTRALAFTSTRTGSYDVYGFRTVVDTAEGSQGVSGCTISQMSWWCMQDKPNVLVVHQIVRVLIISFRPVRVLTISISSWGLIWFSTG
jgi:hypothetical protein